MILYLLTLYHPFTARDKLGKLGTHPLPRSETIPYTNKKATLFFRQGGFLNRVSQELVPYEKGFSMKQDLFVFLQYRCIVRSMFCCGFRCMAGTAFGLGACSILSLLYRCVLRGLS